MSHSLSYLSTRRSSDFRFLTAQEVGPPAHTRSIRLQVFLETIADIKPRHQLFPFNPLQIGIETVGVYLRTYRLHDNALQAAFILRLKPLQKLNFLGA
jgi:hypothetical protein